MDRDKLKSYIKEKFGTASKYAVALNVNRATITRYLDGSRTPDMEVAKKIVHESKGKITYQDIYGKDKYLGSA